MHKDLLANLDYNDLADDMKIVAEVCGMETARILIEKLGGVTIIIPKPLSMARLVDRYILKSHNYNKSSRAIALDLCMNEKYIRRRLRKLLDLKVRNEVN